MRRVFQSARQSHVKTNHREDRRIAMAKRIPCRIAEHASEWSRCACARRSRTELQIPFKWQKANRRANNNGKIRLILFDGSVPVVQLPLVTKCGAPRSTYDVRSFCQFFACRCCAILIVDAVRVREFPRRLVGPRTVRLQNISFIFSRFLIELYYNKLPSTLLGCAIANHPPLSTYILHTHTRAREVRKYFIILCTAWMNMMHCSCLACPKEKEGNGEKYTNRNEAALSYIFMHFIWLHCRLFSSTSPTVVRSHHARREQKMSFFCVI